jgi:hypothetical protein
MMLPSNHNFQSKTRVLYYRDIDKELENQQVNERKSLNNYLNAVRRAKINIHKFSVENKCRITQSLEFNKSIEKSVDKHKFNGLSKKTPDLYTTHITADNKPPRKVFAKSPYGAKMFKNLTKKPSYRVTNKLFKNVVQTSDRQSKFK